MTQVALGLLGAAGCFWLIVDTYRKGLEIDADVGAIRVGAGTIGMIASAMLIMTGLIYP